MRPAPKAQRKQNLNLELFVVATFSFGLQILFIYAFELFFEAVKVRTVVGSSILGLGLGFLLNLAPPRLTRSIQFSIPVLLALIYGLSCLIIIHWSLSIAFILLIYILLGFLMSRVCLSLDAHNFYLFDFVGGILGTLFAFLLPIAFGLESAYLFFLALTLAVHLCIESTYRRTVQLLLLFVSLTLSFVGVYLAWYPNMDLTMYGALYQNPSSYRSNGQRNLRDGLLSRDHSQWSNLGKVEVYRSLRTQKQINNNLFEFYINNHHWFSMEDSPHLKDWVPNSNGKSALILGAGGGSDIQLAIRNGYSNITAVELNSVFYELVKSRYSPLVYNLFNRIEFVNDEGRHFLVQTKKNFDLISLAFVSRAGGFQNKSEDLVESYLYTYEAINTYLDHMTDDGVFMFSEKYRRTTFVPTTILSVIESMCSVLRDRGLDPKEHISILSHNCKPDAKCTGVIILQKKPNTPTIASKLLQIHPFSAKSQKIIAAPGASSAFKLSEQELLLRASLDESQEKYVLKTYGAHIGPTYDHQPYFRTIDIPASGRIDEYLMIAACVLLFGVICFFFRGLSQPYLSSILLLISVGLGFNYGLLELAYLDVFFRVSPSVEWDFFILQITLLFGSACVGAIGKFIPHMLKLLILWANTSLLIAAPFIFTFKDANFLWSPNQWTAIVLVTLTFFTAFSSSLFFPNILDTAKSINPRLVVLLIAANCCSFTVGTIISRWIFSLHGFNNLLFGAAVIYLIVAIVISLSKQRFRSPTS